MPTILTEVPPPEIQEVKITRDVLTFDLVDGRSISVPLAFYPTLMLATPEERENFERTGSSVHWPALDCDINSEALLRGAKEALVFARNAWARAKARRRQAAFIHENRLHRCHSPASTANRRRRPDIQA